MKFADNKTVKIRENVLTFSTSKNLKINKGSFYVPDEFNKSGDAGKFVWNLQTETKCYPKLYKGTSRVKFADNKTVKIRENVLTFSTYKNLKINKGSFYVPGDFNKPMAPEKLFGICKLKRSATRRRTKVRRG